MDSTLLPYLFFRSEQGRQIVAYHRYVPTFALSAGLRMWIKLIMSESHLMDGTKHTDFKVEVREKNQLTLNRWQMLEKETLHNPN